MKIIRFTLDLTQSYKQKININQFDAVATIFEITLKNGAELVDLTGCTVTFDAIKPDGFPLYNACVIDADPTTGKVRYAVTTQTSAKDGKIDAQIVIVPPGEAAGQMSTPKFFVTVNASINDAGAVESTSEFTELQTAIATLTTYNARLGAAEADIIELGGRLGTAEGSITALQAERTGWRSLSGTITFASVDDPIGVINVPTGHGLTEGMRIKLDNGGHTIYGIVVAKTATTVTFWHEIDPTDSLALYLIANSTITNFYYSKDRMPEGFPICPSSWTVYVVSNVNEAVTSPTTTYKRCGATLALNVPIGCSKVRMTGSVQFTGCASANVALSTSATGSSHQRLMAFVFDLNTTNTAMPFDLSDTVIVAAKTPFYPVAKADSGVGVLQLAGLNQPAIISAECAFLSI